MKRLRAEHSALMTLSRILMDLVQRPSPSRPTALASTRGLLRDTLMRHLKCEDWVLYPRLKASNDPEVVQLATEFVYEMGHIADDFVAFDDKWTADAVAADWSGFAAETKVMLTVLAMRMEREDEELYPVAEALDLVAAGGGVAVAALDLPGRLA